MHWSQLIPGAIALVALYALLGYDFWRIENGKTSITAWVRAQVAAHPIIMAVGIATLLLPAYAVRDLWLLVYFAGFLAGHLFGDE